MLPSEVPEAIEQRNYQALRTLSGGTPVTRRSGKKTAACQRRTINSLMQNALYHWARVACRHDAKCKRKYDSLKARGKTHGQALRCVGDRLLAAELSDGGRININADAVLCRRLALHDGAAAEMLFDVNAVRKHQCDDGLRLPGRGFESQICVAQIKLVNVFNDAHTIDYRPINVKGRVK